MSLYLVVSCLLDPLDQQPHTSEAAILHDLSDKAYMNVEEPGIEDSTPDLTCPHMGVYTQPPNLSYGHKEPRRCQLSFDQTTGISVAMEEAVPSPGDFAPAGTIPPVAMRQLPQ